jgi:hypothetical protein
LNPTTWLLLVSVVFYAAYDVFAAITWGREATLSFDILNASQMHPIIALATGIVLGHLFWPQR